MMIGNIIENPYPPAPEFIADLFEDDPILTVVEITTRDMATEEQGYTKSVAESTNPDDYVRLSNGQLHRLAELTVKES